MALNFVNFSQEELILNNYGTEIGIKSLLIR